MIGAIIARTDGNPLFVEEIVRDLVARGDLGAASPDLEAVKKALAEIPEGIRELVGRRLSALSPGCVQMLRRASALEGRFGWELLSEIADVSEDELLDLLDEALLGQVIREHRRSGGVYEFTHDLVRQTLYDEINMPRRVRLHREIGEAIERVYGSDDDRRLAELAHHFLKAAPSGVADRAGEYAERAGNHAMSVLAFEEAAVQYGRALELLDDAAADSEARERAIRLRTGRARAFGRAGTWRNASSDLEAALGLVPEDAAESRAELLGELIMACFWAMDIAGVIRHARVALAEARASSRADLEAAALAWLALPAQMDGDLASAFDFYRRAEAAYGAGYIAPFATKTLTLYWSGRYREAMDLSEVAFATAQPAGDVNMSVFVLPQKALSLAGLGRYDEAQAVFDRARELGSRYRTKTFLARSICMSGGYRCDLFDYRGAEELAREALELARSIDFVPAAVSATLDLMGIHLARGELSAAEALIPFVREAIHRVAGWHGWIWAQRFAQAQAELVLERGDFGGAIEAATAALDGSVRQRPKYAARARVVRGRALAAAGRKREALDDLEVALDAAKSTGDPLLVLRAASARLEIEPDAELWVETTTSVQAIRDSLGNLDLRRVFTASSSVRLLLGDAP